MSFAGFNDLRLFPLFSAAGKSSLLSPARKCQFERKLEAFFNAARVHLARRGLMRFWLLGESLFKSRRKFPRARERSRAGPTLCAKSGIDGFGIVASAHSEVRSGMTAGACVTSFGIVMLRRVIEFQCFEKVNKPIFKSVPDCKNLGE